MGTAIREGRPVIVSDVQVDPTVAPWRTFKLEHDLNLNPFIDRDLTRWDLYAVENGRTNGGPARRPSRATASATVITPPKPILRRSLMVVPSAGRMTSPSSTNRPARTSSTLRNAPGAR